MNNKENATEPLPSSDGLGAVGDMYRGSDGAMTCARCHYEMEWEECSGLGCEDGYYDAYDEDPNFFDPGDMAACPECNGKGGSWWCSNNKCETGEGRRVVPAPNDKLSDRRE